MKKSLLIISGLLSCIVGFSQTGKVGINTASPAAMLHVMDSSVVFTGPNSIPAPGDPPISGMGTRFMWYPQKAALRTGRVTGPLWNNDWIGLYSVAMGFDVQADGNYSIAQGKYSEALGVT